MTNLIRFMGKKFDREATHPQGTVEVIGDMPAPGTILVPAEDDVPDAKEDRFIELVKRAYARAAITMGKYPQPNYTLVKLGEEHGEVVKEIVHYAEGRGNWDFVEHELVDNLAMMIRLLAEGDQTINFTPPEDVLASMKESFCDD